MGGCKVRFLQEEGQLLLQPGFRSISELGERDFERIAGLWGNGCKAGNARSAAARLLAIYSIFHVYEVYPPILRYPQGHGESLCPYYFINLLE